jgi:hypothetical protein
LNVPVIVLVPVAPDPGAGSSVPVNEPVTVAADAAVRVTDAVPKSELAIHEPVTPVHVRVVTRS